MNGRVILLVEDNQSNSYLARYLLEAAGFVVACAANGRDALEWTRDAVPDLIPVLGQLDDLGFVVFALEMFVRLCPAAAVAFHRAALTGGRRYGPMPQADEVIDAEFRRE